ncbi:ubiquitin domain-containing protein DSK2a-like isoform X1 [Rhododendron vialii]|uniref:ubiquitin domain-containing protein DSK2a-like isoform X1 n=1 Tax=Rhododendron vialii TaxID=182163 RepID=UPI002660111F|nr:ubiquitin domain-containing protein DSK2a-like isoform X1 [Rhododendron vialii]
MGAEGEAAESSLGVTGGGAEEEVALNIRCSNGSKFSVRMSLEATVEAFKAVLAQNCDVPADQQRLIYKGRILKNDQTLASYGLQTDHTVHMVRGFAPASSTPAAAAATIGNPTPTPGVAQGVGSNEGGTGGVGLGPSLFPGLGFNPLGGSGASGLFGAGLPEFEQVQQQLTQNPNMMREIMNMPAIQGLMNNPELMRSMIMNNPQMREIIDRNPELAHVLNDPGILRQTLEAARNPELMREMMRNTDRAMSNIESSPEGFNMLRRMYENVQEPFLNATTLAGGTGNDPGSNPFAALLGNQGVGSQTRDGSNNTSTTGSETTTGFTVPNSNPLPNPWGAAGGGPQANTTARSNPTGDARAPAIGGLGGLGVPELERMFGMPDPSSMNQLLQNPAVSQMMQSLLSNPQYMNQVVGQFLGLNPQLRSMLDLNPQLREMMQNPEMLRQLTSPETMQQMLAVQQGLLSQLNRQQSTQETAQTGGTQGTQNNMGLELLMNMLGGLGGGGLAVPNSPNVPPEELYATQLQQLQEMGFFDTAENIRALRATSGNVHAAVERLLNNPGL